MIDYILTDQTLNGGYGVSVVTTSEEREAVFAVRMVVFVEEQAVPPEEELDAYDITATHFAVRRFDGIHGFDSNKQNNQNSENTGDNSDNVAIPTDATQVENVVATARLLDKGEGKGKIGRVAVLKEHRGYGVGALLMRAVEQVAREQGFTYLCLEAQCYAIPFYEKLGYVAEGPVFLDCNIEHRLMAKTVE